MESKKLSTLEFLNISSKCMFRKHYIELSDKEIDELTEKIDYGVINKMEFNDFFKYLKK